MIPQEIIEEIRQQADIVEIISEYVPGLRKNGANYKGLSPFSNEKTPSFIVSPQKNIFKDFSTGRGGSVFQFLQDYLNISFPEAVELVGDKIGVKIPRDGTTKAEISKSELMRRALETTAEFYHNNVQNAEIAFNYLQKRGFGEDLIRTFQIGYSPDDWESTYKHLTSKGYESNILEEIGIIKKTKRGSWYDYYKGRLIFPIRNKLGRTVGFGGRSLTKDNSGPKYLNTPQTVLYDKSKILFGLFEAKDEIRNKSSCILVEGYADVVSLYQSGIKNVVASSGTALTSGQLDLLKSYTKKIFLIYDADKAGINAAEKGLEIAIRKGFEVSIVKLPEGEDPDSIVQEHGKATFNNYLNQSLDFVEFKKFVFEWKYGEMGVTHRSELIRSLISLIRGIPDRFQHSHYISRVEIVLGLSELEKKYFFDELQRYEDKSSEIKYVSGLESPIKENSFQKFEILEIEKAILIFLLDKFREFNELVEEFSLSENNFISEDARYLFSIFDNLPRNIDIFDYLDQADEISSDEKNYIFELALLKEDFNQKLADEKSIEVLQSNKFIKDCLNKLKLDIYDKEYNQLLSKLSDDDNSNIMNRLKDISENIENIKLELLE
ncbi:DNA primase [Candidatus Kapabacteria bacterium]|nr:DNA primase [Candidatus Kapabacteria bacterium]